MRPLNGFVCLTQSSNLTLAGAAGAERGTERKPTKVTPAAMSNVIASGRGRGRCSQELSATFRKVPLREKLTIRGPTDVQRNSRNGRTRRQPRAERPRPGRGRVSSSDAHKRPAEPGRSEVPPEFHSGRARPLHHRGIGP